MQELDLMEIDEVAGALKASVGMGAVSSALLLGALWTAEVPPVSGFLALGGAIVGLGGGIAGVFGY